MSVNWVIFDVSLSSVSEHNCQLRGGEGHFDKSIISKMHSFIGMCVNPNRNSIHNSIDELRWFAVRAVHCEDGDDDRGND